MNIIELVSTFAGFAVGLVTIVEFIKDKSWPGWLTLSVSWIIGIGFAAVAWALELGIFAGLWYEALIIGFGGSLIANGVASTELVQSILQWAGLINKKK